MILDVYPRPQLKRRSFINLNGLWDYKIEKDNENKEYEGKILVPYSPEAKDSGVLRTVYADDVLWYKRDIKIKNYNKDKRYFLNFGAVDQICDIFINSKKIYNHVGGYIPFSIDITDYIDKDKFILEVRVKDYTDRNEFTRGKQSLKVDNIFYKCQSGIWQTVWIEEVSNNYIKNITYKTDIDNKELDILIDTNTSGDCCVLIDNKEYLIEANKNNIIKFDDIKLWSPDSPYLYNVSVKFYDDVVESYFAFRKIERRLINNISYIYLNNKKIFLNGILEQGYYGDNLYTPDSFNTVYDDIKLIKKLGFNTIRKHIKIEPLIYYYFCDKLGILVVQDMVNGGGKYNRLFVSLPLFFNFNFNDNKYGILKRKSVSGRGQFENEARDVLRLLYNNPSVIVYTIFNEAWGQYDTKRIYSDLKNIDDTRLYDTNSGWFDQKVGDFKSSHCYFKKYRIKKDKYKRAYFLSEYGGYSFGKGKKFTYKNYNNSYDYVNKIRKVIDLEIKKNIDNGLVGAIYTQYNDVFNEQNGLVDSNRKIKSNELFNLFKI